VREVKTRLPDDVYEKFKQIAEKRGSSVAEILREIAVRYISGEQVDDVPVKVTPIKFRVKKDGICAYCGQPIKAGEWAYWVIKEFEDGRKVKELWHIDCWEYASDAALAKKYVEIRKLNRVVKALKRQADELADALIEAEARKKVIDIALEIQKVSQEIEKKVYEISDRIREWLFTVDAKNEDLKTIKEELLKFNESVQNQLDELKRKLDEVAAAFIQPKIKKARKKKTEETWIWR